MNLQLICIWRQRLCNLVNECFYLNPLTIQHDFIFIWNLNSKYFITHRFLSSFSEPNHCLTLDGHPHYNFLILQCDRHLTMWKVERMGLWAPSLYKCNDQALWMGPCVDALNQATSLWQSHTHLPQDLDVSTLHGDIDNLVCQEDPAKIITIDKYLIL